VHVLVDRSVDSGQLKSFLESNGIEVRNVRPIEPTLEDVFVTLTYRHEGRGRKAGGS
jgi:hypothetical protein